jgi:hypothetical protein
MSRWPFLVLGGLLLALVWAGCSENGPPSLAELFPDVEEVSTWAPVGDSAIFDRDNLYDLVNGQAEAFFAYGFEQVAVQNYENALGEDLEVEIWQMATPADAYGLFTASISGVPAAIGNDGDSDPGRRLAFWQDRYFVRVRTRKALPDTGLWEVAEALSEALPTGGDRPTLLDRLPLDGLKERSELFFHEEISVQDRLWLGGENILGLGADTDGFLAGYDISGVPATLLLIQYPDARAAMAGFSALKDGALNNLVSATAQDQLLGAVLGEIDQTAAEALLTAALGKQ